MVKRIYAQKQITPEGALSAWEIKIENDIKNFALVYGHAGHEELLKTVIIATNKALGEQDKPVEMAVEAKPE